MNRLSRIIDFLCIPFAIWLANGIRFRTYSFTLREEFLTLYALFSWTLISYLLNYYTTPGTPFKRSPLPRIVLSIFFFFAVTGAVFYTHNELDFSRIMIFLFVSFQFAIPPIVVKTVQHLLYRKSDQTNYPILLVGSGKTYSDIHNDLKAEKRTVTTVETATVSAALLEKVLSDQVHEGIVLALPGIQKEVNDKILELCRNRGIHCAIAFSPTQLASPQLSAVKNSPYSLYYPVLNRLELVENRFSKRLFDILFSAVILTLISPVLLLLALLVKFSMPNQSIFFKQERTGYNQKLFTCYKFRTMRVDNSIDPDSTQAQENDPRVTPLGSFMRHWNLDELPQLFNVLKGDMSLVGPRPHPYQLQIKAHFQDIVPDYLYRHFVIPGMTGWAQVNGYRGPTDTEEKIRGRVEHDLWYIEHWSIWLDIKIMFLTVFSRKVYENAF